MKTIKGITDKLELFSISGDSEKDTSSYQDVYRTILSLSLGKSSDQAIEMIDVALKLKKNKSKDLDLEDSEFKLLKEHVDTNATRQPAFFQAQLIRKLRDAENADTSKKS